MYLSPPLRRSPEVRCLAGDTGSLCLGTDCTPQDVLFHSASSRATRSPELGNTNFLCVRRTYSAPPPPSPLPSRPPHPTRSIWGRKPWDNPAHFTSKGEACFLLVTQRVKAIRAPRELGPQKRRVLCHLPVATGLVRPLPPLSPASLPLHSLHPIKVSGWVCPGSAPLRKPHSGQGS